ncbi:MAG: sporulation protein YtfJ [Oscillospiraceae bacterium]|nr:sporulation protein YtfJ [Oscillospiraceae bacterium]
MSQNVSELLGASIARVRDLVDANTVVGSPIVVSSELTLIPVSTITFGVASGGADFPAKNAAPVGTFGGGAGCGVKIVPVAFVVIQGDRVRVMPMEVPPATAAERVIEQLPDLVDRLAEALGKKKEDITDF